jgi:hypothetical protein
MASWRGKPVPEALPRGGFGLVCRLANDDEERAAPFRSFRQTLLVVVRGIRSSGQFTTTSRFAQGWQGLLHSRGICANEPADAGDGGSVGLGCCALAQVPALAQNDEHHGDDDGGERYPFDRARRFNEQGDRDHDNDDACHDRPKMPSHGASVLRPHPPRRRHAGWERLNGSLGSSTCTRYVKAQVGVLTQTPSRRGGTTRASPRRPIATATCSMATTPR